jgi:hypothetical protein
VYSPNDPPAGDTMRDRSAFRKRPYIGSVAISPVNISQNAPRANSAG